MPLIAWALAAFCGFALVLHAATAMLVRSRKRRPDRPAVSFDRNQTVTILRPVCGLEDVEKATLASSFTLAWPNVELLFCVSEKADPAVAFLEHQIAERGCSNARVLVGASFDSPNPKLNNLLKGWQAARGDWVVMADSNLLLPVDYVEQLLARFTPDAGLVCAPPVGSQPEGFWAEVECGFLNTYQARWQYAADAVGHGFAQGKTMLWRRADLNSLGGISSLRTELAEDAAATKLVRSAGRKIRLAGPSFEQPIGGRTAARVFARQARWAQLRRLTFPWYFAPEIFTGSLPPVLAAALSSELLGGPTSFVVAALMAFWIATEALLAWTAGWTLSWRAPFAWLMRDMMIPFIWLRALTASHYEWHGNKVVVERPGSAAMIPSPA